MTYTRSLSKKFLLYFKKEEEKHIWCENEAVESSGLRGSLLQKNNQHLSASECAVLHSLLISSTPY